MPIYVLGPRNESVRIPNQALTVSISGTVQGASLVEVAMILRPYQLDSVGKIIAAIDPMVVAPTACRGVVMAA